MVRICGIGGGGAADPLTKESCQKRVVAEIVVPSYLLDAKATVFQSGIDSMAQ